jgi:hypothetical protein
MAQNLRIEYEASLGLLKHYDERQLSLVKYATGLSSALAGVVFGAKQIGPPLAPVFWPLVALLAGTVWLALVTVYLCMVENRLYFTFPTRQANWLRGVLLEEDRALVGNRMFLSVQVPAYNPTSVHSYLLILVCVQVGASLGLGVFAAFYSFRESLWTLLIGGTVGGLFALGLWLWSVTFLTKRSTVTADEAVGHGTWMEPGTRSSDPQEGSS